MKIAHYSEKKLREDILRIVGEYLDLKKYKVFFFGSRVKGTNSPRSDIDIGIEGPKPVPIKAIAEIKERISDLPILYHIDVVDFKNTSSDFRKIAKQNFKLIK
jgi:predicted nucleotidyltransferase